MSGERVTVTYLSPRTEREETVTGVVVEGRYPHLYLTLDTEQGVLRIPRAALVTKEEKHFLVCRGCGEAFDSITPALEHGTFIPGPDPSWCGEAGFDIVPESEAF